MSKSSKKSQYRVGNWSEYGTALKQRGSLTFWINEDIIENGSIRRKLDAFVAQPHIFQSVSKRYSDVAIELMAKL